MTKTCTRCHRDFTRPSRRGLCPACYMAVSTRQKAYGRWELEYTDSQPVREHIAALRAAGMGTRAIAEASGLCRSTVRTITVGKSARGRIAKPSMRILRKNADAILAIPVPKIKRDGSGNVDATGTRRRVQALVANGYSQREISRRLGYVGDNLSKIVSGDMLAVKQSTHDKVAALFTELQLAPGDCSRSRSRGVVNRWPLPLDWDEDEIDDPAVTATRSPHRAYDPRFDPEKMAARRAKVAELIDLGVPATEIAARLRCTVRTIERDKQAIRAAESRVAS